MTDQSDSDNQQVTEQDDEMITGTDDNHDGIDDHQLVSDDDDEF